MKERKSLKINTFKELAYQLGVEPAFLFDVADKVEQLCEKTEILDKKEKVREVYRLYPDLKLVQREIDRKLLSRLHYPDSIQGGIPRRSILSNAQMHSSKKQIANFDIKNFFPSIKFYTVYRTFVDLECAPIIARLLTRITTTARILPQGFVTSPKISALVLRNVDRRLNCLFKSKNLCHSFWIDDLTVSGYYDVKKLKNLIFKIFRQCGFELGESKTRFRSSKQRQKCTGLVVNSNPNVEKNTRNKIRKEIYYCRTRGVANHLNWIGIDVPVEDYVKSMEGRINFLTSINDKYNYLKQDFQKIVTG